MNVIKSKEYAVLINIGFQRYVVHHGCDGNYKFAGNVSRDRMLLRTVGEETRAALSDRYRRLNSMKLALTFLMAAHEAGNQLVDAHAGETRNFLEVIHPEIVEFDTPMNGKQFGIFGARYRNSDFGHGAFEVAAYIKVVKCWNGMIGQGLMRQVHSGGSIPENLEISDATIVKDTDAKASLLKDAMASIYSGRLRDELINKITEASAKEIDVDKETEKLPKLGLTNAEVELFSSIMKNGRPDDNVVGAPTLWKFANGLTALARDSEPERKRDLETIAGKMLGI